MDQRREPEGHQITPTQPSMPESRPTTQLPAVPQWAVELTQSMKEGFRLTNANIEIVSNDVGVLKDRVTILESRRNDDDARASKHSGGVRALSQTDLAHDAQLAQERLAREALASKVDKMATETSQQTLLLAQLLKLTEKPVVKLIATAIGTAVLTWLSARGLR